jgi:hypothetical protein
MTRTYVPLIQVSALRIIGPAVALVLMSILLLRSLDGLEGYEGRFSSSLGYTFVAISMVGCIGLLTPIALYDFFRLHRAKCAAYMAGKTLGIYRASPWLPWKRGFLELDASKVESIEVIGPSLRWGSLLRIRTTSEDYRVETYYMAGEASQNVEVLRRAVAEQK